MVIHAHPRGSVFRGTALSTFSLKYLCAVLVVVRGGRVDTLDGGELFPQYPAVAAVDKSRRRMRSVSGPRFVSSFVGLAKRSFSGDELLLLWYCLWFLVVLPAIFVFFS